MANLNHEVIQCKSKISFGEDEIEDKDRQINRLMN